MTKRCESADPVDLRDASPRAREFVPRNPYAVPLSTLVAGAYVAVTQQVQVQPSSSLADDVDAGFGLNGDGDGDGD